MDLSRQEYPALLQSLQPSQAVAVVDERVKLIGKVNSDIAEWLADRRRVEEAYVQGLKKIALRHTGAAPFDFGIFQTPWQSILSSTENLARSHSVLAQKIEADVERPLREYQTKNREMQAISTIQGNLAAMAKELDSSQKKAEKAKGGRSAGNRSASDAMEATRQWESQAPYVFEQLQALDESRTNHLRDVLTQLQTHEVDQVERNRISAESCLNVLLNLNTADEISAFVAKTTAMSPTLRPRTKSRTTPVENATFTSVPSRTQDDRVSEVSRTSEGALRTGSAGGPASTPNQEPKKAGFGGLRRLGTVMGRRKEDKKPVERPPSPEKRSRPRFNALRRGTSSKNMQTIPSPDDDTMPPLPSSSLRQERTNTQPIPPKADKIAPSTPEPRRTNNRLNGDSITPLRSSSLPMSNGVQSQGGQVEPQNQISSPTGPTETQRDVNGFNVPSSAVDEITRAQQEAAATEPDQPQFKLDIRSEPIREEGSDPNSTLSSVASTLRAQASQLPTPRKPSANRGRRDVRNTVFIPTPQTPEIPGPKDSPVPSASPPNTGRSNALSADGHQSSDTHSIRSAHSMSSLVNTAVRHPEMTQPGLNASVVETISSWFSQGQVTKAIVVGELALVNNSTEVAASSTVDIRLDNFPVLEKVAPNPSFVTQMPSGSGEYSINTSQIARTSVAFKYQVHLEESNLAAHVPFILNPSWKIEPTQTSVIINYMFNPAFASSGGRSVSLKNLIIIISLDSTKVQGCQSKPVGNFSKEKSLVYWKLGDVTLDAYAEAPQKLLARFSTELEAKPGSVEARWEISGESAAGLGSGLGLSQMNGSREERGSDPFADESVGSGVPTGAWKEVGVTRKLISGKYAVN